MIPLRILIVLLFLFSNLRATETRGFLTREDIALFYKQGYLLKKQCLTLEEMNRLNKDITLFIDRTLTEIQQSDNQSLSDQDQVLNVNGSRIVFKRFPNQTISIARVNGVSGIQPIRIRLSSYKLLIFNIFRI